MRAVTGTTEYEVFGWKATGKTAAYLILGTLVNLTTLALFSVAMATREKGEQLLPNFDPTQPESLILSSDASGQLLRTSMANPNDPASGSSKVAFGRDSTNKIVRLWVGHEVSISTDD